MKFIAGTGRRIGAGTKRGRGAVSTSAQSGFTMIELLMAMAIFTMLGTMALFLMTQTLDMFGKAMKESATLDRQDAVLPVIEEDISAIRVVSDTDAPPPAPKGDGFGSQPAQDAAPLPPVQIRLRSGTIKLAEAGKLKNYQARYVAFVIDISEGLDPTIASLDTQGGADALDITPTTVRTRKPDTRFKATRGLMEVCYIAIPTDIDNPAVMTLYRGFRSPIGDPQLSLLDPANLDSRKEILAACEPVDDGILHFDVTWRRVFAHSWEEETARRGMNGELTRYVGPAWDSTRGADATWALFAGTESLSDPSDDVFPSFVRLEVVMASPTSYGYGRGDIELAGAIGKEEAKLVVSDVDALFRPGKGRDRWLKIDKEWMRYTLSGVNYQKGEVRVERGMRSTVKEAHDAGSWIHLGTPASTEIQLPVWRDRFTLPKEGTR